MTTIRGHQGQFRILEDGEIVDIIEITKVSVKLDTTMIRSKFVGKAVPVGDQSIDGWSGNISCEVQNDKIEQFLDALITNNLAGIGVKDYAFVITENYADGTSVSYLYDDVQWGYSREQGSYDEKIMKTMDFQASFRTKL